MLGKEPPLGVFSGESEHICISFPCCHFQHTHHFTCSIHFLHRTKPAHHPSAEQQQQRCCQHVSHNICSAHLPSVAAKQWPLAGGKYLTLPQGDATVQVTPPSEAQNEQPAHAPALARGGYTPTMGQAELGQSKRRCPWQVGQCTAPFLSPYIMLLDDQASNPHEPAWLFSVDGDLHDCSCFKRTSPLFRTTESAEI